MAEFERLSFTKDWKNPTDFPTYEENEAQVREDMQLLHDEVKNFINEKLIPGIEGMAVPGTGDMLAAVYDPKNRRQDVYAYAAQQDSKTLAAAKTYTDNTLESYDTTQEAKLGVVSNKLNAVNNKLKSTIGQIELLAEYTTPGTHMVSIPHDTAVIYALAIGGGGGGGAGYAAESDDYYQRIGGGGGGGGNAVLLGPILPDHLATSEIVVGEGGASGKNGGSSSVFGIAAKGGKAGVSDSPGSSPTATGNEIQGGATGGRGANTSRTANGYTDRESSAGTAGSAVLPLTVKTFSAGGGGGGNYNHQTGAAGGVCGFGAGGRGGDYGAAGEDGGQCCGGGGGGQPTYTSETPAGGKGGDGYVAIWIQRTGSAV